MELKNICLLIMLQISFITSQDTNPDGLKFIDMGSDMWKLIENLNLRPEEDQSK